MLFSSLYVTATGVQAATNYLDVTSNNVANSSTPGFKTVVPSFQDLLYTGLKAGQTTAALTQPQGTQLGEGVGVEPSNGVFTQGTLTPTGRPLDLAVDGLGFFQVQLPDGTTGYTRSGAFTPNALGQLTTTDGFLLAPGITVPDGTTAVDVGADGTVTATTPAGPQVVGQLSLTRFLNPAGLLRIGDTLFTASGASGPAITDVPGASGLGVIQPGSLEGSNVDLSAELVNLLVAQRTFQANSQALLVENDSLSATTALIT